MFERKFIGWAALAFLIGAATILILLIVLLVFSSALARYVSIDPQAMIIAASILAFAACSFGFYAKTSPGRIGAIGGLILFIVTAILLSLTAITSVEKHSATQIQPLALNADFPVIMVFPIGMDDSHGPASQLGFRSVGYKEIR